MKIAIISLLDIHNWENSCYKDIGGIAGVIRSILPYLSAQHIVILGCTTHHEELFKEIYINDKLSVYAFFMRPKHKFIPERLLGFVMGYRIIPLLKQVNLVYSHVAEIGFWLRSKNIPYVYHMHGPANALAFAKHRIYRLRIFQHIWSALQNITISESAFTIAIDSETFNQARMLKSSENIIRFPNFVNTDVFFPEIARKSVLGFGEEYRILLYVGRIEEVKGLELYVDALIELNNTDEKRWRGVIVGEGAYLSKIKKYISIANADNLVTFLGPIFSSDTLRKIYNTADLLSITSFHEGIPMAILESLACGTPIISVDVGGIKTIINERRNGVIINCRDKGLFAKSAIKLLNAKLGRQEVSRSVPLSSQSAANQLNKIFSSIYHIISMHIRM